MERNLLGSFNWIDVVILIIVIRAAFVGFRRGAVGELIFTIGFLLLGIISIEYYSQIGQFISYYIKIPLKYSRVISYLVLVGGGFILIWLISRAVTIAVNFAGLRVIIINKIFGIVFGIVKGFAICSILLFLLMMLNIDYLSHLIENDSYSGSFIVNISFQMRELMKGFF